MAEDGQEAPKAPPQPSEAELRQFAQEKSPEELQKIEGEKAQLEAQYEERQLDVATKAERLQEKIKQKEEEIERVIEEVEKLKEELAKKQEGTLQKIFNLLEVRALREKIGIHVVKAEELQKEFAGLLVLYDDLQREARSKVEIDEAERLMGEFYADQTQKLEAHEKDKQARDVTNVSRKHNAVLTHSFLSWKGAGQVSVMKRGVGWKDMLHTTLSIEPHISTASVRMGLPKNEPQDESFFALGVLLKSGEITEAKSGDASTGVVGGERKSGYQSGEMEQDINQAISKDGIGHNEISVRNPKIAALFFDSDILDRLSYSEKFTEHGNKRLIDEMLEEGKQLGMPVYVRDVKSGQYFLATGIREEEKMNGFEKIIVRTVERSSKPVGIEDILNSDFKLNDEQKDEMKKRVLAGDLFNDFSAVAPKQEF